MLYTKSYNGSNIYGKIRNGYQHSGNNKGDFNPWETRAKTKIIRRFIEGPNPLSDDDIELLFESNGELMGTIEEIYGGGTK